MAPQRLADQTELRADIRSISPRRGIPRAYAVVTPRPVRQRVAILCRCVAVHSSSALLLGIDVGTQGAKAIVFDPAQRAVVSRSSESYDILPTDVVGRAEQWPDSWTDAAFKAAGRALDACDRAAVRAIGVSGQQHSLVMLDKDGKVVRPAKLWCDIESAAEAEELSHALDFQIPPGFTGPKLLWMQLHEPESYAAMATMLLPASYMNFVLTGEKAIDAGDSSGTGFFDLSQRNFSEAQYSHIDERLGERLPRLAGPSEVVGTLLPGPADVLGLSTDVVVSVGSGDNACSALGVGAVNHGDCVISLGTSGTLFGCFDRPLIDPSGAVAPFCDATGLFLPLVCTMNCTSAINEVRDAFRLERDEIEALASEEAPGCSGINFLPYLTGERTPNWPLATAAILGLRPGYLRPGLMYRAAMEGATFALLGGLERMQELGFEAENIRLVGGGSRSRLFQQVVADAFQRPVHLPTDADAAAIGAALQAGAALESARVADYVNSHAPPLQDEVVKPRVDHQAALNEAFQRHQRSSAVLYGQA